MIQQLHISMRTIRGTQSYWHKAYTELLAMVRNLGPPSWYLTFSCNDLGWTDFTKALLKASGDTQSKPQDIDFERKRTLIDDFPVTLARQFMKRFHALLKVFQSDRRVFRKPVVDMWWRIEFQMRGSPHVHMVVWCGDMPEFDSPEGLELINRVVMCEMPINDEALRELILKVQCHRHSNTCYKRHDGNRCRFGFPRELSDRTVMIDPDDVSRCNGRVCKLKRKEGEERINNYSPILLKLWRANMDIQPCGSAIGVAYYISKYVAKSEPSEITKHIADALLKVRERGGNMEQQVFAVQNAILNHRQVSASECAFRLCHLQMRHSSRKCVFVNTCFPEQRYRMISTDTHETRAMTNIFDRYVKRPLSLEELSLGEFAVQYEPVVDYPSRFVDDDGDNDAYGLEWADLTKRRISLLDSCGSMKKRSRPAILRTRYFTLDSDPAAYSLLVTHVPFRREEDLLTGYDTSKDAFFGQRHLLRPIQPGISAEVFGATEVELQQAISRIVAENLDEELRREVSEHTGRNVIDEENPDVAVRMDEGGYVMDVEPDMFELPVSEITMTDEDFRNAIRMMNLNQKQLFAKVSDRAFGRNLDQLLMFITGGAGSGKTFTLKLIVEHVRRCSPSAPGKVPVIVTAPTGVAARLIHGNTLHSTFSLPIEKGKFAPLRNLSGERLQMERTKWKYVEWLIIDEVSMVSYEVLRMVHIRLQELKNNSSLYGGVNVLLFGDLMQLPPVTRDREGAYCFLQPSRYAVEPNLWRCFSFTSLVHELTENMRQGGDSTFIDILNALRVGSLTMEHLHKLDERRIPLAGEFADGKAIRIFPTRKQVDEFNNEMTTILGANVKVYNINAIDTSREPNTYGQCPKPDVIPDDPNRCGGLLGSLVLGVGSRIMLRRNISIGKGLVNGATGVVMELKWNALRMDQLEPGELPSAVSVQFDDKTINKGQPVLVEPFTSTFDGLRGYGKVERKMLPVILCWAVTVHKLQGCTLDHAVIDLGAKLFAKGQAYVALSRVRSLEGLAISQIHPGRLLAHPHDARCLDELQRLRALPQ